MLASVPLGWDAVNTHLYGVPALIHPVQIRMARAALRLGVRELAEKCGLSANTVSLIENGNVAKTTSISAIEKTLSELGVTFLPPDDKGPGIRVSPPRN